MHNIQNVPSRNPAQQVSLGENSDAMFSEWVPNPRCPSKPTCHHVHLRNHSSGLVWREVNGSHLFLLSDPEKISGWRWRPHHWSLPPWPQPCCFCLWSWRWWQWLASLGILSSGTLYEEKDSWISPLALAWRLRTWPRKPFSVLHKPGNSGYCISREQEHICSHRGSHQQRPCDVHRLYPFL